MQVASAVLQPVRQRYLQQVACGICQPHQPPAPPCIPPLDSHKSSINRHCLPYCLFLSLSFFRSLCQLVSLLSLSFPVTAHSLFLLLCVSFSLNFLAYLPTLLAHSFFFFFHASALIWLGQYNRHNPWQGWKNMANICYNMHNHML